MKAIAWPEIVEVPSAYTDAKNLAISFLGTDVDDDLTRMALSIMDRITDYDLVIPIIFLSYNEKVFRYKSVNHTFRMTLIKSAFGEATHNAVVFFHSVASGQDIDAVCNLLENGCTTIQKPFKAALIVYIAERIMALKISELGYGIPEIQYDQHKDTYNSLIRLSKALQAETQLSIYLSEIESARNKYLKNIGT